MRTLETDVLVVGSGIAGLTFALRARDYAEVLVLTKKARADANTNYAQGGIAAVVDPGDSYELHVRDTLLAGAGLCHREVVEDVVRDGPARVEELMSWGVSFSREGGQLDLGREGGHSRRRILHSADLTGQEIEGALLRAVEEDPRIRLLEDHFVWSLLPAPDGSTGRVSCGGALVLDVEGGGWIRLAARAVMLASGGAGRVYRHTTNPAIATGDGVAMAHAAGAAVANMEFVQFHPTALYPAREQAFLISEAVRGEGAVLRRRDGAPFMDRHHPQGSLAPRDVVARATHAELAETGDPHVWLDLSALSPDTVGRRFPTIRARCAREGIQIPDDPVPVVPAAHYFCGGVLTDRDGRTSLPGLLAAGEVACTGVHGANRLASNSLLEAVVFARRASLRLEEELAARPSVPAPRAPEPDLDASGRDPEEVAGRVRDLMWEDVGIVRSDEGLEAARSALRRLLAADAAWDGTPEGAMRCGEVAFMLRVASLVVRCAARREESRGLHHTRSHPHRDSERFLRDTVLTG